MKRRTFLTKTLRWSALGLGATGLGLSGALALVQPHSRRLTPQSPDDANRPLRLIAQKRVIVVGGGISGLVAALELAERNFAVTLLEQAPDLGGKLGGWKVRALGEEFPVEHGFHGFFSQYYNLREVLERTGGQDSLEASSGYPVLFRDRPEERFGRTSSIFPLNLLETVLQARALHLADFRRDGDGLYELMRFDEARTFARFDGIDFARFCREGRINRPMVDTVLGPFGKTTLNRSERLSAAEALRFFHFYYMGNPEGLAFRFTRRDSMSAIIGPLRRRLESLGVQVRVGVAARRLVRQDGAITKVVTGTDAAVAATVTLNPTDVPATGFAAVETADGSSIFVTHTAGGVLALDGHCTHMGCPVAPDPATGGFRCPCHGGAFDSLGQPTAGPPVVPLRRLTVQVAAGGALRVQSGGASAEESLPCDYCVVACEVRGVRRLVAASELREPVWQARVAALGEADPYVVWRLWLDRPTLPSRSPFYTVSRYRFTDALALYSQFQEPYRSWAARRGGSVVELHAYAIAPEALLPAAQIRAQMLAELRLLLPELASARILHDEYQQQSNFTRWAPGDYATRPTTSTPLPNLFLAGDHVRLDVPAALMEAATISGRMAANGILRAEQLREVPITTVALKGPLA